MSQQYKPITVQAFSAVTIEQFLMMYGALKLRANLAKVMPDLKFFLDYRFPMNHIINIGPWPWTCLNDVMLVVVARGEVDTIYEGVMVKFKTVWDIYPAHKDYMLGEGYNELLAACMFRLMSLANSLGVKTPLPPNSEKTRDVLHQYCIPSETTVLNIVKHLLEGGLK